MPSHTWYPWITLPFQVELQLRCDAKDGLLESFEMPDGTEVRLSHTSTVVVLYPPEGHGYFPIQPADTKWTLVEWEIAKYITSQIVEHYDWEINRSAEADRYSSPIVL
jgi:hypothetical protein